MKTKKRFYLIFSILISTALTASACAPDLLSPGESKTAAQNRLNTAAARFSFKIENPAISAVKPSAIETDQIQIVRPQELLSDRHRLDLRIRGFDDFQGTLDLIYNVTDVAANLVSP